jgi:hypothetical protein
MVIISPFISELSQCKASGVQAKQNLEIKQKASKASGWIHEFTQKRKAIFAINLIFRNVLWWSYGFARVVSPGGVDC